MKLLMRIFCIIILALAAIGLSLYLSTASLTGASAVARGELSFGLLNIANKLAVIAALIAAMACAPRSQWRWLIALVVVAIITTLSGPLGVLTNTDVTIFIVSPFVAALLTLAYTYRMGELTGPSRAWWNNGSSR